MKEIEDMTIEELRETLKKTNERLDEAQKEAEQYKSYWQTLADANDVYRRKIIALKAFTDLL